MLWPILAFGFASTAAPTDMFEPYLSCLHRAEINAPSEVGTPVIVVLAKNIEACAEERDRLLQRLTGPGDPRSSADERDVSARRADRRIVDAELDLLRQRTNLQFEEGISHLISNEEVVACC